MSSPLDASKSSRTKASFSHSEGRHALLCLACQPRLSRFPDTSPRRPASKSLPCGCQLCGELSSGAERRASRWPCERSLRAIPPGRYWVQAVLNRYETFHRADGQVVKLPPDMGEGQHWEKKPGNLYSAPRWIRIDPRLKLAPFPLVLGQIIPPIPAPAETRYVKHIRIQSDLLTRFWGRPVYLGA